MFTDALYQLLISEEEDCPDAFLNSWKRKRDEEEEEDINLMHRAYNSSTSKKEPPMKKTRAKNSESVFMYVIDRLTGLPRPGIPGDSLWWINYVLYPELMTPRMHFKFRRRFRMPFDAWQGFVAKMKSHDIFKSWHDGASNCTGKKSSPLELLSLGAFRYLGRKCTFDDLEECTFISERTDERFFHKFIEYGSTVMYNDYIVAPQTSIEADLHMHEFRDAGFDGGIGSMDATHVTIENCRYGIRQSHLGFKLNKTARSYNIIVNHRRRILSSTSGHPLTWNDKTLVLFDQFIDNIKRGNVLADKEFTLLEKMEDGTIIRVTYRGVWILVDNGYHEWSITIPPFKYVGERKELRWSQWMESMRKDVECTFGILKKRWSILSKGIHAKSVGDADKVWKMEDLLCAS